MKVKELIQILSDFNQDAEIFVAYDAYIYQTPDFCYHDKYVVRQTDDEHLNCYVHVAD